MNIVSPSVSAERDGFVLSGRSAEETEELWGFLKTMISVEFDPDKKEGRVIFSLPFSSSEQLLDNACPINQWRWRESNPRPKRPPQKRLRVYPLIYCLGRVTSQRQDALLPSPLSFPIPLEAVRSEYPAVLTPILTLPAGPGGRGRAVRRPVLIQFCCLFFPARFTRLQMLDSLLLPKHSPSKPFTPLSF